MKNQSRLVLVAIITMLLCGMALGLGGFQNHAHNPPNDTCVAVQLRDKFPADSGSNGISDKLYVLYGYIYSSDSAWIKLGKKPLYQNQYVWVPISNVAAILPYDKCDDKK